MYGKIQITGEIEVITGMHIGGSSQFSAIGAVDSPVIRDKFSDLPIIPGSSLKGKLRSLMAKYYSDTYKMTDQYNDDPQVVLRLFGNSKKEKSEHCNSRLLFTDMILQNMDELKTQDIYSATEVKFENSINRVTSVANPRQIERVIRGSKFNLDLIYNIENEEEIQEDFRALKEGIRLLEFDYLGGNGSRGYGKIQFKNLQAKGVIGEINDEIICVCNQILEGELNEI